jgi:hypothetical protein
LDKGKEKIVVDVVKVRVGTDAEEARNPVLVQAATVSALSAGIKSRMLPVSGALTKPAPSVERR